MSPYRAPTRLTYSLDGMCVVLGDYQVIDKVLGRIVLSFAHDERALQCRSYHN